MSDRSGRPQVTASDYLGNQKKALAIDQRRPVIRKASDLVGPGIGANAVRITNFNDLLATYNGFFASDVGAAHAPNDTDQFSGVVTSDAGLGGAQSFTSLSDGKTYRRTFTRSPLDAGSLFWSDWMDPDNDLDARVTVLEGLNAGPRLTALEARTTVRPLRTGIASFFGTMSPDSTISATVGFGTTFSVIPAAWAIKAGFVTGSTYVIVSQVDQVTTTDCRIVLANLSSSSISFTDLPIRWFAQRPD